MPVKVLSRGLCLPDVAAGDNEIEQHRNFSKTHFPGVAPCRFRLVGHDVVICKGYNKGEIEYAISK